MCVCSQHKASTVTYTYVYSKLLAGQQPPPSPGTHSELDVMQRTSRPSLSGLSVCLSAFPVSAPGSVGQCVINCQHSFGSVLFCFPFVLFVFFLGGRGSAVGEVVPD